MALSRGAERRVAQPVGSFAIRDVVPQSPEWTGFKLVINPSIDFARAPLAPRVSIYLVCSRG